MQKYKTINKPPKPLNKDFEKSRLDTNRTCVCAFAKTLINTGQKLSKEEQIHRAYKKHQFVKTVYTQEEKLQLTQGKEYFTFQYCGYASHKEYIEVNKNKNNTYSFKGTANCGYVHRCNTCNIKIMKAKQEVLYKLANAHLQKSKYLGFTTLTQKTDSIKTTKDLLQQIKKNYRKFQNLKFYQNLKKQGLILGQVVTTETTYNDHHNGHHHLHILYFFNTDDVKIINEIQKQLIEKWAKYTDANLKAQDQKVVNKLNGLTEYISKWDVVQEMTNDQNKNISKGLSYFQLAEAGTIIKQKIEQNPRKKEVLQPIQNAIIQIMSNHIEATKGTRKVTISKSLFELYDIEEKTDEELLQEENTVENIIKFSRLVFIEICKNNIKPHILCICYEEISKTEKQLKIYQLLLSLNPEFDLVVKDNETYILTPGGN